MGFVRSRICELLLIYIRKYLITKMLDPRVFRGRVPHRRDSVPIEYTIITKGKIDGALEAVGYSYHLKAGLWRLQGRYLQVFLGTVHLSEK